MPTARAVTRPVTPRARFFSMKGRALSCGPRIINGRRYLGYLEASTMSFGLLAGLPKDFLHIPVLNAPGGRK